MDDRKFLDRIRRMKEEGRQISLTEASDAISLEAVKAGLISEAVINLDEKPDVQTLDPDEQREEENKFKERVAKLVKFNEVKVHKENVEWSGTLIREKIDWVFSLDDAIGCYIKTISFSQLTDNALETLKSLRGYYDIWADEWGSRLTGTPTEPEEEGFEETGTEEGGEFGAEEGGFGAEEGGGFGGF
jgi:hypothetical protein